MDEVPWQNLFSQMEMEEYGDLLNPEQNEEMVDLEKILQQSESQTQNMNVVTAATCAESCAKTTPKSVNGNHIIAERKRRQELSQRFIALSATIPGLTKIDKASILKEAITYVKHLQNRVRELEEGCPVRRDVESVFVHKTHHSPQLEARVLQNHVLIRIHCHKHQRLLLKILTHITTLGLSLVTNSVLSFANRALCITIVAQMDEKYNVTVNDLVKSLRRVIIDPESLVA
ncbi:hypothetical protein Fmac_020087 [Flemingia macrophylla]|uniref:BHLH domain-containing protein n=1 Tax=Flemingia macrophylla TaxID=520843 RepID=A0ABD1M9R8_9FABA